MCPMPLSRVQINSVEALLNDSLVLYLSKIYASISMVAVRVERMIAKGLELECLLPLHADVIFSVKK